MTVSLQSTERRASQQAESHAFSWSSRFLYQDAGGTAFRLDVQGMRAVAVLLVLLFHARFPVPGGLVGVDIFFVISGFIITGALVRELESSGRIDIKAFYARRAKRLLPATVVVLVGTLILTLLFIPETRWRGIAWDFLASTFYVENWRLAAQATDYQAQNAGSSPLQHFRSLGVEEQFYLIWPGLLLLVTLIPRGVHRERRSRRSIDQIDYFPWLLAGMALIILPSFAWSVWYTANNPNPSYFASPTRLWELAVGGGVAIIAHHLLRIPCHWAAFLAWTGLVMAIASAFLVTEATAFPGYAAALPVLGTALVIGCGPAAARGGRGWC